MPTLARVLYQDPFSPKLLSSPPLEVTDEQKLYIREVCSIAASDEQFAQKAYNAILYILTGGNVKVPSVTSLNPTQVSLGSPTFDIHVMGKNFTMNDRIVFNGFEEPTTFVSDTELTTGVNMDVWLAPAVVPVSVISGDGVVSNTQSFIFIDPAAQMASQSVKSGTYKESLKPVVALPKTK